MTRLTLDHAQGIIQTALATGREMKLKPLTVAVLDDGGHLKAFVKDGGGLLRYEIATGKAWGALGLGMSSRSLGKAVAERPAFGEAIMAASGGRIIPVPGGVLIRDADGAIMGAVGVSGDASDNDEACAVAGIESVGLKADAA